MEPKHLIIVGAGFAGLNAAKNLSIKNLNITIIDKRNYHLFQPLLYQVAMAGLSPAEIATPIRSVFSKQKNVNVILGEVKEIFLNEKKIEGSFGILPYDYLLIATGSEHSYFGHSNWEEYAPGLKTLEQATEIRRRVLTAFELAEQETDIKKQKALLTFVVIGGGPTGVEIAGALGEISRFSLIKDFRKIDPRLARIILIEAGPRILNSFKPESSAHAVRDLEKLGVSVWTSTRVTAVTNDGIAMNQELLQASTVIWAAGVKPSELNKYLQPQDHQGRVLVNKDLSLPDHPEVFVAGDLAHFEFKNKVLPGQAPAAMQQGLHVAENIRHLMKGEKTSEFKYNDKGQMATIGRSRAVVNIGQIQFYGFSAWIVWLVVHIYYLIGFRNRLIVLLQWIWSYFGYKKGARLIVNKEWKQDAEQVYKISQ